MTLVTPSALRFHFLIGSFQDRITENLKRFRVKSLASPSAQNGMSA
jgi:hypothetical protein